MLRYCSLCLSIFSHNQLWQLSSRNSKTKPSSSSGASSGIGLVTVRLAAKAGAKLVLAARSEDALRHLTDEITQAGGQATYVVADVSKPEDVRRLAQEAASRFGGYDTWINNAGVHLWQNGGNAAG